MVLSLLGPYLPNILNTLQDPAGSRAGLPTPIATTAAPMAAAKAATAAATAAVARRRCRHVGRVVF